MGLVLVVVPAPMSSPVPHRCPLPRQGGCSCFVCPPPCRTDVLSRSRRCSPHLVRTHKSSATRSRGRRNLLRGTTGRHLLRGSCTCCSTALTNEKRGNGPPQPHKSWAWWLLHLPRQSWWRPSGRCVRSPSDSSCTACSCTVPRCSTAMRRTEKRGPRGRTCFWDPRNGFLGRECDGTTRGRRHPTTRRWKEHRRPGEHRDPRGGNRSRPGGNFRNIAGEKSGGNWRDCPVRLIHPPWSFLSTVSPSAGRGGW